MERRERSGSETPLNTKSGESKDGRTFYTRLVFLKGPTPELEQVVDAIEPDELRRIEERAQQFATEYPIMYSKLVSEGKMDPVKDIPL